MASTTLVWARTWPTATPSYASAIRMGTSYVEGRYAWGTEIDDAPPPHKIVRGKLILPQTGHTHLAIAVDLDEVCLD